MTTTTQPPAPATSKRDGAGSRISAGRLSVIRASRRWHVPIVLTVLFLLIFVWRLHLSQRLLSSETHALDPSVHRAPRTTSASAPVSASIVDTTTTGVTTTVTEPEHEEQGVHTHRVGCREYPKGGQSCVFTGISCIDVNETRTEKVTRPLVYLVDDDHADGEIVSSDRWCQLRHKSSDPRYFANRDWPPRNDLIAPRWSCLNAKWRTEVSLLNSTVIPPARIKWLDEISLVDLDYVNNDHNNHYVKDIVWMLDVALWQDNLISSSTQKNSPHIPRLFGPPMHVFLPQSRLDFEKQTRRDVNKLNLAIILQQNARGLYEGAERTPDNRVRARPILEAYPDLEKKLVFYQDERTQPHDLVCTRRLIVGSKLGDMGHERVCQHLRSKAWELFGIAPPPRAVSGYLMYERPPRRVVLLQRHVTRRFRNIDALTEALRNASRIHDFEFEVHPTSVLRTAEEHVRFFSRIGVLITPHGSQSMGGMWMPRHAALIEVFPPAYTDFAYSLLSGACNLWYYELQGIIPDELKDTYATRCGNKGRSFFNQCTQMKSVNVQVDVDEAVRIVLYALKRLGHDIDPKGQ